MIEPGFALITLQPKYTGFTVALTRDHITLRPRCSSHITLTIHTPLSGGEIPIPSHALVTLTPADVGEALTESCYVITNAPHTPRIITTALPTLGEIRLEGVTIVTLLASFTLPSRRVIHAVLTNTVLFVTAVWIGEVDVIGAGARRTLAIFAPVPGGAFHTVGARVALLARVTDRVVATWRGTWVRYYIDTKIGSHISGVFQEFPEDPDCMRLAKNKQQ